ncbi:amidinotransferase [Ktedonobacteria bacterium brp13]|nr:amidinotransferase [Ktedonobacteria bacterium brp13]
MSSLQQTLLTAAQGGYKWLPREVSRENFVDTWGDWGSSSECSQLHSVLLKRPGRELSLIEDFDTMLIHETGLDLDLMQAQHAALGRTYMENNVAVYYVESSRLDKPNAYFCRDLMLMTPEGAIIARPASRARAGEERYVAETLGCLGVPILMTVHGAGTFEAADVSWVNKDLCFLAEGLRTNRDGADQVEHVLREIGTKNVVRVQLPYGVLHLDCVLNFLDRDLAVIWPQRTPYAVWRTLRDQGFRFIEIEDAESADYYQSLNFVALEPGKILMPRGDRRLRERYEEAGVTCIEVELSELIKGGGGIHCMTAFLKRSDV